MAKDEDVLRELESAVDAFVAKSLGPRRVRKARSLPGGFDKALWRQLGELGWLGILVSDQYGGLGLSLREMALVARHLSKGLLPEPLSACAVLAAMCVGGSDNESLKSTLLPALCEGKLLPTVAWQESAVQIESEPVRVQAKAASGGIRLTGSKCCVPYGDVANGFIVTAQGDAGTGLYWVSGEEGLVTERHRLADESTQATVMFDGAPAELLCTPSKNGALVDEALDAARLVAGAELVGIATGCLDLALNYLRTRTQFGKPIGSFQALQHRAVDLYVQKELSISALHAGLVEWEANRGAPLRAAAASRAKSRCSDTALLVARESIQMHGAIGWTDECDIGLFVKRALLLSAWLGSGNANRRRYARLNPMQAKH